MKKIILILALAVFTHMSYAGLGFKIGPKVGFNASKLSTSLDTIKTQFKSGFSIGAFARIGKKVYVQPEIYYTTDGGIFSSNLHDWKQTVKLSNLNVPVLVGYSFINKIVNIRVFAGPMVSFVINKNIKESGGIDGPIKDANINTANWYLQAGAGVDIWMLTLDIRYQVGLNKIITDVGTAKYNSSSNGWVVSLGFKFF
jgi:hypothetical protein